MTPDLVKASEMLWKEIPRAKAKPVKRQDSFATLKAGQLLQLKDRWVVNNVAYRIGALFQVGNEITSRGIFLLTYPPQSGTIGKPIEWTSRDWKALFAKAKKPRKPKVDPKDPPNQELPFSP